MCQQLTDDKTEDDFHVRLAEQHFQACTDAQALSFVSSFVLVPGHMIASLLRGANKTEIIVKSRQ